MEIIIRKIRKIVEVELIATVTRFGKVETSLLIRRSRQGLLVRKEGENKQ